MDFSFLRLLGYLLDFISLIGALYIANYLLIPKKSAVKENIKKATFASALIVLAMIICELVIPEPFALLTALILFLTFGFSVNHFYGDEWLAIFSIALLIALMFIIITNAFIAVISTL